MKYLTLLIVILSMACNNEDKSINEANISNDFIAIDSLFYSQFPAFTDTLKGINEQDVSAYYDVIVQPEIDGCFYDVIPEFLIIVSLKKSGQYENYIEHLDIGQLQDCLGYLVKNISLSDEKKAIIWGINYSSYEACPAYNGDDIFLTILEKEIPISTIQIGSNYNVVDPPMAFESMLTTKQEGYLLKITLYQKEMEMGELSEDFDKIIEENHQIFKFDLNNVKFIK
jgi:hypothetical protein